MKKYAVELVGTFFFVLTIIGVINTSVWNLAPLYIGLALAILIYIGGAISGWHYNPAVTLALLFNKSIKFTPAIFYVISQIIGAGIAFVVAEKVLGLNPSILAPTASSSAIFTAELLFTFALISAVFFTAVRRDAAGNNYFGLAIGGTVIMWAVAVGGVSGGFFNPAVLFGLGLYKTIPSALIFTILGGQIAAAIIAYVFYRFVVSR